MRVLILIALMALGGCATTGTPSHSPSWVNTKDTSRDFETDVYECRMEATAYVNNMGYRGNVLMIAQKENYCLKLRGWVRR